MHANRDIFQTAMNMHKDLTEPSLKLTTPKPSCSYHCMIAMALQASPVRKLPVNEIYKYILNNFPYFRTAADNWKNSVRHCLSLGQCFHKVGIPGMFAHKKGFHWETVADKIGYLNQEIERYLTSTGQSPEWFGIYGANLTNSSNQGVPVTHSTPGQSSSVHSSSFISLTPSSFCPQSSYSPAVVASPMPGIPATHSTPGQSSSVHSSSFISLTPSSFCPQSSYSPAVVASPMPLRTIDLELNQTDLQILQLLAQTPHCQSEESSCDSSFLTGTDVNKDLNAIESYLKAGGSLTNLLDQTSLTQNISSPTTKPAEVLESKTLNASKNTTDNSHADIDLELKQQQGITGDLVQDKPHSVSLTGRNNTTKRFSAASVLPKSRSTPVKVNTDPPNHLQEISESGNNVEYCDTSVTEFSVKYPSKIGRIEEEILTIEFDTSYPFLCSDDKEWDMTLNQLTEESDSDTSDEEEPIPKTKKRIRTWRNPLNLPFEPVIDDWNSWKESEYEEKMKKVVITTTPKCTAANSSHVQSKSTANSSKCSIAPRGAFLSVNVDQHCKQTYKVHHNGKQQYVRKETCQSQTEDQYSNITTITSQADSVSKLSITDNTLPESCKRESSITKTIKTKIIQMEDTDTNERHYCEDELSVILEDETNSIIVSIPFVKLLTSRQIKKYCSRLNK